jgi:iron-sulfur cluster repair protein YtfE (RIC family)
MQHTATPRIDARMTVNETVQRYPATLAIFADAGIDTCCGGSLPIEEAARRHGIELRTLLTSLETVAGTC